MGQEGIPWGRSEDPTGPGGLLCGAAAAGTEPPPHPRGRSERARTARAGLRRHIAAPSRRGSQHVLRPPRKNVRSVKCGFGFARLLVKFRTRALRFPGLLEFLVCFI